VVVGAFVIGAIFTPPDVVSQIMLAVPLWLLYELGIVVASMMEKRKVVEAEPDYQPLSDEEMESELDAIEAQQKDITK
jgi:sec-independent protein translocase protein TatC